MLMPRYLGAKPSYYITEVTKLMMFGAIHRVFQPGCKYDLMLCLVGGQGVGKSSFFRMLALEEDWFSDDLRRLDDDAIYRKINGHWIIEMPEMLATASAKSIEEIKAFITRSKDTYKIPYATHPQDMRRQCIFVGTSNNNTFLPFDRTGNRRFLSVKVDGSKAECHPLENEKETKRFIEQCWAEAYRQYMNGESYVVVPKDLQEEVLKMQESFMPEDTEIGILEEWLKNAATDKVCSRMIYEEAFGHTGMKPNNKETREISCMMEEFSDEWEYSPSIRFESPYGTQRGWRRKEIGFVKVDNQKDIPFID